jgi:DNA-binding NarL/FixJ family response regulator
MIDVLAVASGICGGGRAVRHSAVTVVVGDGQPVVRRGLQSLLGSSGITMVGEATTARETVQRAVLHKPDVVVVDIGLPDFRLDTTIQAILRVTPSTCVLVFTAVDSEDAVITSLRAGARGYILKTGTDERVVRAIYGIAMGETVLCPGASKRLVNRLENGCRSTALFPQLTSREQQIFELMESGLRNATIATQLQLSPKTVGNHITTIFAKLHVASRPEAVELARQHRLGRGRADGPLLELVGPSRAKAGPATPALSLSRQLAGRPFAPSSGGEQ